MNTLAVTSTSVPTGRRRTRAGGFSLVELMFAVILLAFGLMGVAATLSLSAGMTQNTVDESAAARVAQAASSMLAQCMTDSVFPSTGGSFQPFTAAQTQAMRGQMLSASDRRFAWIPMYRRDDGSSLAQLVIVIVRAQVQSEYTLADATPDAAEHLATFIPTSLQVDFSGNTVSFSLAENPADPHTKAVAPGAILVLKDAGDETGEIYKVSELVDAAANKWSLAPGFDKPTSYTGSALVIGRGYADDANPAAGFDGPLQAVSAYATFVQLK